MLNTKIYINGDMCTYAGAPGCIQYFATSANGAHVFYDGSPVGEKLRIDSAGSISCTGNIMMGTNNSYPDIRLGSTNGSSLGIATTAGAFSSSSAVNDMVIRSINRLILQSGGGVVGLLIDYNDYTALRKISQIY
jgi:hypothetical protein